MWEFLLKLVVEFLFEVRRSHIFNDRGHVRGERQQSAVLPSDQLRVVEQMGVIREAPGVLFGALDSGRRTCGYRRGCRTALDRWIVRETPGEKLVG